MTSITRKDTDPTSAPSVRWDVTFATPVTGLAVGNFSLAQSGGSGALVTGVTGSGTTYVVTASTGTGGGTLGLNLVNNTGLAPTVSNVPFTGDVYTINLPPVITLNGPNPVTLECFVDFYVEQGATALDPEDGPVPVTVSGTVDRTRVGTYTRTYTAPDSDGATASVTRTVNVVDTRPPVITAPSQILVEVAPGVTSQRILYSPPPTASDVATGNVLVISTPPSGTTFPLGTTTVTCTATDRSGNTATTTFNVIVREFMPPAITLNGPNPLTLECNVDTYVEPGATALDPEDGTVEVTVSGTVDTAVVGTYTLTYTATDSDGHPASVTRTVNVVDTLPPVITAPSQILVEVAQGVTSQEVFYSSTATDVATGNVPVICSPPSGATFPVGTTTVTCTATDISGNTATATFDVIVREFIPPAITLNGPNPLTLECNVDTYVEPGATALDPEDGPVEVTVSGTVDTAVVGTYTLTYTATDSDGATASVTRTVNVVDTLPPVITAPTRIFVPAAVGGLSGRIFYSPTPTATDVATGNVPVTCSQPSGSTFPVGTTTVTCTAIDSSGNTATKSFDVIVLEYQAPMGTRYMDVVSQRGDMPEGTGDTTVFNVNRAFLNNTRDVIYDATLSGPVANNTAVLFGPAGGGQIALAVKGNTAAGGGNFGAFNRLTLNNLGHKGFESLIGTSPGHFADTGGGLAASARKSGTAPTGGGETYNVIHLPAMASNGELLTPASLSEGSGAGVTVGNDTVITSSAGTVIAREGSPTSIPGTRYAHMNQRVVTSEASEKYAFTSSLTEPVFNPATNSGIFVGTLGAGLPDMVVQKGDAAAGAAGTAFFQFQGEAVNSAGEIALRASITGTGITSSNNEGIWSNAGNVQSPPVLVAREGALAPEALPRNQVAFASFPTLHMNDDGSVVFFAFLRNAGTSTTVTSANDGSIWRWSNGELELIAREGDVANNTGAGRLLNIYAFDCNEVGGVVYAATLVPGVGDTTTDTNLAVYVDRGAADPAPLLVMRRGDTFDIGDTEHSVVGIRISTEVNPGGGTGGYGRAINDNGDVVFNLTLSGNKSGIFLLGTAPNIEN